MISIFNVDTRNLIRPKITLHEENYGIVIQVKYVFFSIAIAAWCILNIIMYRYLSCPTVRPDKIVILVLVHLHRVRFAGVC